MKKLMKVLCFVLVLVMVVAPVTSLASFTPKETADVFQMTGTVNEVGGGIYAILRAVAIIVAVCMIAYMAIQWFLATPSKKAELKGRMWSMAIGVVLLIGGVWVLNTLEAAVNEIAKPK